MSENDKLMSFGTWLTSKRIQHSNELYSLSLNTKAPVDAIRLKAGHLEATQYILDAFTQLYNQPLNKFMVEYMGAKEEDESDGETNDQRGT